MINININKYRIMNRFINCDCIKNKKGELIPLWKIDWKLDSEYLDKDDLENSFIVPEDRNIGDFIAETDIVKALWDLIDKKVVPCKRVIKIYSDSTGRVGLKEGDEIYVKHKFSSNEIYPTKIKTITQGIQENVYYTTENHLKKNWLGSDTEIIEDTIVNDIPGNNVVQIITYRKHYVLEDGTETDYDYDFFKLKEK
jgi:hypothetical protein